MTYPAPHIASSPPSCHQILDRNRLARVRRAARKRGFRIRKDWSGGFNLITANTVPPRALAGLEHVSLSEIEAAVCTPLSPPKPVRIAVGRLAEKAQAPQAPHPAVVGGGGAR
jgi:hypothetical protein